MNASVSVLGMTLVVDEEDGEYKTSYTASVLFMEQGPVVNLKFGKTLTPLLPEMIEIRRMNIAQLAIAMVQGGMAAMAPKSPALHIIGKDN